MGKSIVYFAGARSLYRTHSLEKKIERLFNALGLRGSIEGGDRVAIKVHWGSEGNTRYLRPIYVKKIVELVKKAGGTPFIFESVGHGVSGPRATMRYLEVGFSHGYTPEFIGAPVVLGGGFRGNEVVEVDLPEGIQLKRVSLVREAVEADKLLVLTHFKGHSEAGFGGSVKNIGVGCTGKKGKTLVHFETLPYVDKELCDGCKLCLDTCDVKAISMMGETAYIDHGKCWGCWKCVAKCREHFSGDQSKTAIKATLLDSRSHQTRVAEHVAGLIKVLGRERVYAFNFLLDVTPLCDCPSFSDVPIVPDLGILASRDIVAVDQASLDLVNRAPGIPGSMIEEVDALEPGSEKFRFLYPYTDGGIHQLVAAEKLGVGSRDYELVVLEGDDVDILFNRLLRKIEALMKLKRKIPEKIFRGEREIRDLLSQERFSDAKERILEVMDELEIK